MIKAIRENLLLLKRLPRAPTKSKTASLSFGVSNDTRSTFLLLQIAFASSAVAVSDGIMYFCSPIVSLRAKIQKIQIIT